MFSYVLAKLSSEPDELEIEESRRKVCNWRIDSSGVGSELQEEDISYPE